MTSRRVLALVLALAPLSCGDVDGGSDDEGGGDEGEVALPDHDAALRCPAASAPELAGVGPVVGSLALGPCGHLAYHDDEGVGWLVDPSGVRSALEHDAYRVQFAPTGDQLAFERSATGALVLRDLLAGSERTVASEGSTDAYGFVPSFAAPELRGAWLWSCEQDLLMRHDASTSELVAEGVVCRSVVASSGSPRLAFADREGRVHWADLDGEQLRASEDLDWAGDDGSKRDDSLWIDHEGELIVHVAIEWQGDADSDSEWPVDLWSRVIDVEGEVVLDRPQGLAVKQAARRGAPVFVLRQGEVLRFDGGAPSTVATQLESAALSETGELFFTDEADAIWKVGLDAAEPSPIAQLDTPTSLRPSAGGEALTLSHHSDICIVDALGECDRILAALRRWQQVSGLSDAVLLSSSPWQLEATLDDGTALLVGSPVVAEGPTYAGEQPPPSLLWLDPSGAVLAEYPAPNGDLATRQTFALGSDRVLVEYQGEAGQGELLLARADVGGFVSLAPDQDVALLQAWVDGRAERVAFVSESAGGSTLWFGALPQ